MTIYAIKAPDNEEDVNTVFQSLETRGRAIRLELH